MILIRRSWASPPLGVSGMSAGMSGKEPKTEFKRDFAHLEREGHCQLSVLVMVSRWWFFSPDPLCSSITICSHNFIMTKMSLPRHYQTKDKERSAVLGNLQCSEKPGWGVGLKLDIDSLASHDSNQKRVITGTLSEYSLPLCKLKALKLSCRSLKNRPLIFFSPCCCCFCCVFPCVSIHVFVCVYLSVCERQLT